MSWDLSIDDADEWQCCCTHEWNYTHNCNQMIRDAGFGPEWPYDLNGMTCHEVERRLRIVLRAFEADPARFRAMDPENGWGSFDTLRPVLREIATVCRAHPLATVRCWA